MNLKSIGLFFSLSILLPSARAELFKKSHQLYDFNADIFRDAPQLIRSRGFECEQHSVTTIDGYILTLFRIVVPMEVGRQPKRPVLLWHGIAVTADSWLLSTDGHYNPSTKVYIENGSIQNDCNTTVTDTLGFTLASCGYDVWLANSRGSSYSNRHVRYDSLKDSRYWQYTLTELAIYDIPAVIKHILKQTQQQSLAYVGHSLGTDIMFILQSLMPEISAVIRPYIALAPVAFLRNIWSSARFGIPLEPILRKFPGPLGVPSLIMQFIGVFICGNELLVNLCADVLYTINGFDSKNFNRSIVPVNVAHSAVIQSTWVYAHLAQMVSTGEYRMMDFGPITNRVMYGSFTPPRYPLENITSPNIALFRGLNDPLADTADVENLVSNLNVTLLDNYIVPYSKWNHQDFQLGISQGFYVNRRLLKILRKFD